MSEKINVAEILKDCPSGMELDCTMYEDVYFDYIDELNIIHCYIKRETHKTSIHINQHGTPNSDIKSKCVIFPKGKTTWEGFVPPHCQFKNGDVVATTFGTWVGITLGGKAGECIQMYCVIDNDNNFFAYFDQKEKWVFSRLASEEEKEKLFKTIEDNGYCWNPKTKTLDPKFKDGDIVATLSGDQIFIFKENAVNEGGVFNGVCYFGYEIKGNHLFKEKRWRFSRLATSEEKQKLFDAIKENGYKWNAKTKTLENLIVPKFTVGDKIVNRNSIVNSWIVSSVTSKYYGLKLHNDSEGIGLLPVSEQDDWELLQIAPKFKVGDTITNDDLICVIKQITKDSYILDIKDIDICNNYIFFIDQDKWKLVTNKFDKFDISILKPFDKVLIRQTDIGKWGIDFYGYYDKEREYHHTIGRCAYKQCIPYEDNEHLLGTNNECNDYYKTWK